MVVVIDEVQIIGVGNDFYVSGSDVENNNQDVYVDMCVNDKDKKNSFFSDEENFKFISDSNVFKDFIELYFFD